MNISFCPARTTAIGSNWSSIQITQWSKPLVLDTSKVRIATYYEGKNEEDDHDDENDSEDNEAHDKLEGIPEEPIEKTESSDTPQLDTPDGDPRLQDGDGSKEAENNDTPDLEEPPQATDEDNKPQSITEKSSESKLEESTSTPEDSLAPNSSEAAPKPEPNDDLEDPFEPTPNTTDDIPPSVPEAPPSNDIHEDGSSLSKIDSHQSHRSHQSHSSQLTVHFADEIASTSSKSKVGKSKKDGKDKNPAAPEVPRKPSFLLGRNTKKSNGKSSRSTEEQPNPPLGDPDDSGLQSRGKKRKAKDTKEKSGRKKSRSKGKDISRLALVPILRPSDPTSEIEGIKPTEDEGAESAQGSQITPDVIQVLSELEPQPPADDNPSDKAEPREIVTMPEIKLAQPENHPVKGDASLNDLPVNVESGEVPGTEDSVIVTEELSIEKETSASDVARVEDGQIGGGDIPSAEDSTIVLEEHPATEKASTSHVTIIEGEKAEGGYNSSTEGNSIVTKEVEVHQEAPGISDVAQMTDDKSNTTDKSNSNTGESSSKPVLETTLENPVSSGESSISNEHISQDSQVTEESPSSENISISTDETLPTSQEPPDPVASTLESAVSEEDSSHVEILTVIDETQSKDDVPPGHEPAVLEESVNLDETTPAAEHVSNETVVAGTLHEAQPNEGDVEENSIGEKAPEESAPQEEISEPNGLTSLPSEKIVMTESDLDVQEKEKSSDANQEFLTTSEETAAVSPNAGDSNNESQDTEVKAQGAEEAGSENIGTPKIEGDHVLEESKLDEPTSEASESATKEESANIDDNTRAIEEPSGKVETGDLVGHVKDYSNVSEDTVEGLVSTNDTGEAPAVEDDTVAETPGINTGSAEPAKIEDVQEPQTKNDTSEEYKAEDESATVKDIVKEESESPVGDVGDYSSVPEHHLIEGHLDNANPEQIESSQAEPPILEQTGDLKVDEPEEPARPESENGTSSWDGDSSDQDSNSGDEHEDEHEDETSPAFSGDHPEAGKIEDSLETTEHNIPVPDSESKEDPYSIVEDPNIPTFEGESIETETPVVENSSKLVSEKVYIQPDVNVTVEESSASASDEKSIENPEVVPMEDPSEFVDEKEPVQPSETFPNEETNAPVPEDKSIENPDVPIEKDKPEPASEETPTEARESNATKATDTLILEQESAEISEILILEENRSKSVIEEKKPIQSEDIVSNEAQDIPADEQKNPDPVTEEKQPVQLEETVSSEEGSIPDPDEHYFEAPEVPAGKLISNPTFSSTFLGCGKRLTERKTASTFEEVKQDKIIEDVPATIEDEPKVIDNDGPSAVENNGLAEKEEVTPAEPASALADPTPTETVVNEEPSASAPQEVKALEGAVEPESTTSETIPIQDPLTEEPAPDTVQESPGEPEGDSTSTETAPTSSQDQDQVPSESPVEPEATLPSDFKLIDISPAVDDPVTEPVIVTEIAPEPDPISPTPPPTDIINENLEGQEQAPPGTFHLGGIESTENQEGEQPVAVEKVEDERLPAEEGPTAQETSEETSLEETKVEPTAKQAEENIPSETPIEPNDEQSNIPPEGKDVQESGQDPIIADQASEGVTSENSNIEKSTSEPIQGPVTEEPIVEAIHDPAVDKPIVEEPIVAPTQEPLAEESIAEKAMVEAIQESIVDETSASVEEPVSQEPNIDQPVEEAGIATTSEESVEVVSERPSNEPDVMDKTPQVTDEPVVEQSTEINGSSEDLVHEPPSDLPAVVIAEESSGIQEIAQEVTPELQMTPDTVEEQGEPPKDENPTQVETNSFAAVALAGLAGAATFKALDDKEEAAPMTDKPLADEPDRIEIREDKEVESPSKSDKSDKDRRRHRSSRRHSFSNHNSTKYGEYPPSSRPDEQPRRRRHSHSHRTSGETSDREDGKEIYRSHRSSQKEEDRERTERSHRRRSKYREDDPRHSHRHRSSRKEDKEDKKEPTRGISPAKQSPERRDSAIEGVDDERERRRRHRKDLNREEQEEYDRRREERRAAKREAAIKAEEAFRAEEARKAEEANAEEALQKKKAESIPSSAVPKRSGSRRESISKSYSVTPHENDNIKTRLLSFKKRVQSEVTSPFMANYEPHIKEKVTPVTRSRRDSIVDETSPPQFEIIPERPKMSSNTRRSSHSYPHHPHSSSRRESEITSIPRKEPSRRESTREKYQTEEDKEARRARKEVRRQERLAKEEAEAEHRLQREKDDEERRLRREARRRRREEKEAEEREIKNREAEERSAKVSEPTPEKDVDNEEPKPSSRPGTRERRPTRPNHSNSYSSRGSRPEIPAPRDSRPAEKPKSAFKSFMTLGKRVFSSEKH
ncbi:hypothetical protein DSL72_001283 [Monilinia vaccinii-corymbosi]|uniref:Uncharacterized protein n=1 Tax=Monilinia vaccinii-corymbosi TaxID=61207 RepID=A0A8A3P761_9HELO|nr:hypothetical protein DSL72_001283 [Monilinia vaccinii-corymbosi]